MEADAPPMEAAAYKSIKQEYEYLAETHQHDQNQAGSDFDH